jgi:UDP-N-acetylmuramoyl-L-alanyl-D-glutamate--2,6-diaminopimelate ligase
MNLGELIHGLDVRAVPGALLSVRVCDLTEDSRTAVPGSLFVARSGLKADGKRFVADAVAAGAVAVLTDDPGLEAPSPTIPVVYSPSLPAASAALAERFYGQPSRSLLLAGVTGTNGKTTITFLIWQLLNASDVRCGLIGTVLVDDGREVGPAAMTTPPAIEVSRSLASMVEAGCRAASMEVSSHALDQRRTDGLAFRVGVFTNLTGDHLDYHGTMENYAAAKARLFEALPPTATAIINADDPWGARMASVSRAPVWTTSIAGRGDATCRARVDNADIHGMDLRLEGPWGAIDARVPLIGAYNAMNVLQAVAAAHALGLSREALAAGIPVLQAPPGRLERVSTPTDDIAVFVDYAHSDDSLASVLTAVGSQIPGRGGTGARVASRAGAPEAAIAPSSRLWAVFGCGGDRDRTKRPRMGLAAAQRADVIVVTSDNPRTERPASIIDQILGGIPDGARDRVTVQADRARAIHLAVSGAAPGDVVVIAGKGHETEQILPDGKGGTVRTHFDDREVAREALALRRHQPIPAHP